MAKRKPKLPTPEAFMGYLDWHFVCPATHNSGCKYSTTLADDGTRTILFSDGTKLVIDGSTNKGFLESVDMTLFVSVSNRHLYSNELNTVVECGIAAQYPSLHTKYSTRVIDAHLGGVCEFE